MKECRDRGEGNFLYKTRLQGTKTTFKNENGKTMKRNEIQVYRNQIFKMEEKNADMKGAFWKLLKGGGLLRLDGGLGDSVEKM